MSTRIAEWSHQENETVLANYHLNRVAGLTQAAALIKAQENLPAHRRRKVHANFVWSFNKDYLKRDDFKLDAARTALDPEKKQQIAQAISNTDRIFWNEFEIAALTDEWIENRLAFPYASATELLEKTQRKILPGDRQRSVQSILSNKSLVESINRKMLDIHEKLKLTIKPPEPVVQVVTIEVPRKLTAAEMLETLDEPTLEALLCSLRLSRESRFHGILRGLAAHAGATGLPEVKPFTPRLEAFDDGAKRPPRIAVIGLQNGQTEAIQVEIKNAALDVVLRFPDPKDQLSISRCDNAIICRGKLKEADASVGDRTIGQLGRNRVVLLNEGGTLEILQAVRNIVSRQ